MGLSPKQMKKIREHALQMDWDVAFDGKSKGNMHLSRVSKLANFLLEREGGEEDIILAGAWLHDIGLIEGNIGHCFKGANIAKNFLEDLGLDENTVSNILHCIEAHDGEIEAKTMEAKVVHDADTADKMGPLGIIRHTWKMANVDYHNYTVNEIMDILPKHLRMRKDNLYLNTAVELVDHYTPIMDSFFDKKEYARPVLREVCSLARNGVPTEMVVQTIRNRGFLDMKFKKTLDKQLNLLFLEYP